MPFNETNTLAPGRQSASRSAGAGSSRRRGYVKRRLVRQLHHGDWIVQQVRSEIGALQEHQDTLASLGLLKIGRSGLFDGQSAASWGMIAQVQSFVAIAPLTRQPSHVRFALTEAQPMKTTPYEVDGRPAYEIQFARSEYLTCEVFDGFVAINWSTSLPIATVVLRLGDDLLDRLSGGVVFDRGRRAHRQLAGQHAVYSALLDANSFPFVRLQLGDDLAVTWNAPTYPTHVDEAVRPGRLGLLARRIALGDAVELIRETGTPAVGPEAEAAIAEIAGIAAPYLATA